MMAAAARAVAGCLKESELRRDSVLPDVDRIRCETTQTCVLQNHPNGHELHNGHGSTCGGGLPEGTRAAA